VEAASPVLIEKVRAAATDASGRFQVVDLRPGTYTVTFTLPGFNTVKRDGVVLTGVPDILERVVMPALPSSVAAIRWTPDGQAHYISVNPPVPFACAESCLSTNPPPVWGSICRVAVAGGPATSAEPARPVSDRMLRS
jgi:hypothetical protein